MRSIAGANANDCFSLPQSQRVKNTGFLSSYRMVGLFYYLNGRFNNQPEITLHRQERSLNLGDGLFETMYINQNGIMPAWQAHWQRFKRGAKTLAFDLPLNAEQIIAIIKQLLELNQLTKQFAYARIQLCRGPADRGLALPERQTPWIIITVGENLSATSPVTLGRSSIRIDEQSPLTSIKHSSYLSNLFAYQQAQNAGFNDALRPNTQGVWVETSCANFYILMGKTVITPPLSDGALPGTTRTTLIQLLAGSEYQLVEQSIGCHQLQQAEACFITSSLTLCRPCSRIDEQDYVLDHPSFIAIRKRLRNYYQHASALLD